MPLTITTQIISAAPAGSFWIKVLETSGGNEDRGRAALFANGAPYLAGGTENIGDAFLGAKYDTSGNLVWARRLDGTGDQFCENGAIESSGNLFIGGWDISTGLGNTLLVKYDSSGTFQWQVGLTEGGVQDQYIRGVAADSSGNCYITGQRNVGGVNQTSAFTIKYNSAGVLQWQRRLGGDPSEHEEGKAIAVDDSGNVYITGEIDDGAFHLTHDILVAKYNSSGVLQWQRDIGTAGNRSEGSGIAIDGSGNVFVVGYDAFFSRTYVLKLNSTTGAIITQRQINGATTTRSSLDNSGNLYVTCNGSDTYIFKYDNNLSLQWQRKIEYVCGAAFNLLGVDTDGTSNIYVAGYINNQSDTVGSVSDDFLIASLPVDGSGTGTCGEFVYGNSSLTESAGTLSEQASTLTDQAAGLSTTNPSFTSATPSTTEHDCSTLNCDGGAPPSS